MAELSANAMQKQIDVLEHKLTLMYNKNIDLNSRLLSLKAFMFKSKFLIV